MARTFGHSCKRPFACALSNCKMSPRRPSPYRLSRSVLDRKFRSKPPSLAIPTAIAPENRTARKAAIHDASSSPGNGGVRQAGRAQPVPPGASGRCRRGSSVSPRLAEALTPRPGTPGTGGHARGRLTAPSAANCAPPTAAQHSKGHASSAKSHPSGADAPAPRESVPVISGCRRTDVYLSRHDAGILSRQNAGLLACHDAFLPSLWR